MNHPSPDTAPQGLPPQPAQSTHESGASATLADAGLPQHPEADRVNLADLSRRARARYARVLERLGR